LIKDTIINPKLFIANEWSPATTCQTFDIDNPATGEVMGQVVLDDRADAIAALEAASQAILAWYQTTGDGRSRLLKNAGQLIYDKSWKIL
jgi:succinate-semialdehyde dehydrogenase/glutarate-semialdehyde dehydrogenase